MSNYSDAALATLEEARTSLGGLLITLPPRALSRQVLSSSLERLASVAEILKQRAAGTAKGKPPMRGKAAPTHRTGMRSAE
jgi:hypothetical protein